MLGSKIENVRDSFLERSMRSDDFDRDKLVTIKSCLEKQYTFSERFRAISRQTETNSFTFSSHRSKTRKVE